MATTEHGKLAQALDYGALMASSKSVLIWTEPGIAEDLGSGLREMFEDDREIRVLGEMLSGGV